VGGPPSFFTQDPPPYRLPRAGAVLMRSFLDRTLRVLSRAVVVAAPCGLITWLLANISLGDSSLLVRMAGWLDPLGRAVGLDGMILLAFVLGLPANETVLPILLMGYLGAGSMLQVDNLASLQAILAANGWTWLTALNFMVFAVFHWPCATTLLTINKETGSAKWTLLAAVLPTALGLTCCLCLATAARLLGR